MNDFSSPSGRTHLQSFEAVALPCLEDVARLALAFTRNRADADDLVQETFLRAFRRWDTFIAGSEPRRWLFTICRNIFLRERQRQALFTGTDDGDLDAMPAVLDHAAAMRDGLGGLFELCDVRPAIERAVDALPEPYRSALVLVDVGGQSYGGAAEILGVPTGTVRSRLFRARRVIQRSLLVYAQDAGIGSSSTSDTERDDVARR